MKTFDEGVPMQDVRRLGNDHLKAICTVLHFRRRVDVEVRDSISDMFTLRVTKWIHALHDDQTFCPQIYGPWTFVVSPSADF